MREGQEMTDSTHSILGVIGNTPMLRLTRVARGEILAKAEFLNPGGSIKDRIALSMIETAEKNGELTPDKIVLEATSGNTGIGLALVGAVKGYRVVLTMPESMSIERRQITSLGDHRTGCRTKSNAQFTRHDLGKRGLADLSWAADKDHLFLQVVDNRGLNISVHRRRCGVNL